MNGRIIALTLAVALVAALAGGCSKDENVSLDHNDTADRVAIDGIKIFPVPPRSNNSLEAKFEDNPTIEYTFTWQRNGIEIAGEYEPYLDAFHFQKSDEITITVTGVDASTGVETKLTDSVHIRNTAPVILEASTFAGRDGRPELYLHVNATDVDEDHIQLAYQWYRGDEKIEGETRETLSPLKVSKGDEVYCVIVANDGDAESLPFASKPVKLDNHAPRIASSPPSRFNENGEFIYAMAANDTDGDPLQFELLEGPDAMSIDERGTLRWAPTKDVARGTMHTVRVQVSDANGGSVVQEFNLSVPEKSEDSEDSE
jgi:hypothetical protein